MTRVATTGLESGDVCFALQLRHLHPDRELDAEAVTRDSVAFVTALEGQRDARFVLQTACFPDPRRPEHGRIAIHLIATLSAASDPTDDRIDELCDDLLDLLAAPPVRWSTSKKSSVARSNARSPPCFSNRTPRRRRRRGS